MKSGHVPIIWVMIVVYFPAFFNINSYEGHMLVHESTSGLEGALL